MTSLSSEPLFPIACDCKTFPMCAAVCTIWKLSCCVSFYTGGLDGFAFSTWIGGFDCVLPYGLSFEEFILFS